MRTKANAAQAQQAPTPQLDLPFVQPSAAHDLSYYIGICTVFAAYHKRWPTRDATREEFRAARIQEFDGQRLDRELRFPSVELEADPDYQALRERVLADPDKDGVDLAALEPRYRVYLDEEAIGALFDTITQPGRARAGTVRYATGVPAHGPDELTLHVAETLRLRALRLAGFDPADPRARTRSFSLRVRATEELAGFLDRAGLQPPSPHETLADCYRLDADGQGRLFIKHQVRAASRYVGKFDVARLTATLAGIYGANPDLAPLRAAPDDAVTRQAGDGAP